MSSLRHPVVVMGWLTGALLVVGMVVWQQWLEKRIPRTLLTLHQGATFILELTCRQQEQTA